MATSIIKTDEIRRLNDQVLMSDGALTNNVVFPAGHVLQVLHTVDDNNYTFSSGADDWTGITNLYCDIVPKFSNSKIMIMYTAHYADYGDGADPGAVNDSAPRFAIGKNGTILSGYNQDGGRGYGDFGTYIDIQNTSNLSHFDGSNIREDSNVGTTSSVRYQVMVRGGTANAWANQPFFINRTLRFSNNQWYNASRMRSTITLFEVKQ
jgi:hypothetical protein